MSLIKLPFSLLPIVLAPTIWGQVAEGFLPKPVRTLKICSANESPDDRLITPTTREEGREIFDASIRTPWQINDRRDYTSEADSDEDGILDAIDPNPGLTNPKVMIGGPDYTFVVLGSGRVASLQITPALFDDLADGMDQTQIRDLTAKVYAHFQDVFDFILFTSDQTDLPPGSAYYGIHFGAKNDTHGLGRTIYDDTASFGSSGHLQAAIHLTTKYGLLGGPSLHEIMHRWGAFLTAVPSAFGFGSHWGYSSVGGQLGGWKSGSLEDLGSGRYRARNPRTNDFGGFYPNANGGNGLPYSALELYLMGLIPSTGLPDIQIANDFQWVDFGAGIFSASSIDNVSMNQVIATDGQRMPDHTASQRSFRAMHVILVKVPLTDGAWAQYDADVYRFTLNGNDDQNGLFNFWEATGGRATITMGDLQGALISPAPTPSPSPSATPTPTSTPTSTPTPTPTPTVSPSPLPTPSPTPTPSVTPSPTPASTQALNISTRLRVETGDNVLIGGFIIRGSAPKKVVVRAIGPSLTAFGLLDTLLDPVLELHKPDGGTVTNDNWKSNQVAVEAAQLAPTNDAESAIVETLAPGAYTAIVRGKNNTAGVALVEVYDADVTQSKLINISTRGAVKTGDNAMIGGFIIGGGQPARVLVRAIGPSLTPLGVSGALQNPTLELHNADGTVITNNDWRETQETEIIATDLAPTDNREAAILATMPPGAYTAIVRGEANSTGVALVEAYFIE